MFRIEFVDSIVDLYSIAIYPLRPISYRLLLIDSIVVVASYSDIGASP